MKVFKFAIMSFLLLGCGSVLCGMWYRNNDYSNIVRAYPVVWADVGMFENTLQKN